MSNLEVRTRIAPSPTGEDMHIGNIYAALFNFVFARQKKGKFIFRLEDTDRTRFVPVYEKRALESISWLGLNYDEGPNIGGPFGPYRQSERLKLYQKYAQELVNKGQAYYCFCSEERLTKMRKEQQASGLPPKYDRKCRALAKEKIKEQGAKKIPYVIRLKIPDNEKIEFNDLIRGTVSFDSNVIDDQILLKSDGYPTYHLAVVVDDHLMEITHVIRAEEWLSSVPKHILLYNALGWELPTFAHLPVLRNPDKSKMSKRKNPVWTSWYRKQGFLPEAILNYLALLGWSHPEEKEVFALDELIEKFSFDRFSKTGPIFDLQKLEWMNGVYIRQLKVTELNEKLKMKNEKLKKVDQRYLTRVIPLVQERMKKLSEFDELTDFFFTDEIEVDPKLLVQKGKGAQQTKAALSSFLSLLSPLNPL
ncbi:MAG: glutamate--tRNA ligase, partial [Candidatus Cloacimonetes bacterium]|nr:glutamate--tRNA ligase [Candidatus Cloacimonadota bacterium]